MKALVLITAAASILTAATAASAHDYGREERVDARRAEQAHRINHGRHTGELTLLETWRLKAEQRRIAGMERAAERDGYISRSEADRISAAQDRASRDIYRESHDREKAWWRRMW